MIVKHGNSHGGFPARDGGTPIHRSLDGLFQGTPSLKWMIEGYPHFRKPPFGSLDIHSMMLWSIMVGIIYRWYILRFFSGNESCKPYPPGSNYVNWLEVMIWIYICTYMDGWIVVNNINCIHYWYQDDEQWTSKAYYELTLLYLISRYMDRFWYSDAGPAFAVCQWFGLFSQRERNTENRNYWAPGNTHYRMINKDCILYNYDVRVILKDWPPKFEETENLDTHTHTNICVEKASQKCGHRI